MGETKKGQGSEKRRRNALFGIRLDDNERAALRAAADNAGLSVGAYGRMRLIGNPGHRSRRATFHPDMAELARLRGDWGHVGSNLNQLTRLANIGDLDRPRDLDRALEAVLALIDRMSEAMGQTP